MLIMRHHKTLYICDEHKNVFQTFFFFVLNYASFGVDCEQFYCKLTHSGVQSINNVYAIVNKVENVLVNTYIFDLIDNGVYVVYALYSSIYDDMKSWSDLKIT